MQFADAPPPLGSLPDQVAALRVREQKLEAPSVGDADLPVAATTIVGQQQAAAPPAGAMDTNPCEPGRENLAFA